MLRMDLSERLSELVKVINELRNALDQELVKIANAVPELRSEILSRTCVLVDLEDVGDAYVLRVDLPGFSKNEVRVRVSEEFVEIVAEMSESRRKALEGRKFVIRERIFEKIRRVVKLPSRVNPDAATAKLIDGVLEVYLPKVGAIRQIELRLE